MECSRLEFAPSVRFVEAEPQSIILDLRTRKWVRLPALALAAVRTALSSELAADGGSGTVAPPARLDNTLRHLADHGFLVPGSGRGSEAAQDAGGHARARTLYVHVTERCNLACRTCYVADYLRHGPDAMSGDAVRRVLRIAARAGFTQLQVTGGEPLLRPDLFELLTAARASFSSVHLTTNGTELGQDVCLRLIPLVDGLNISLDGPTAAANDRIRGTGSFARTVRGLEALVAAGYPMERVGIVPTVTRLAGANLEDILDLAARFGAGVSFGFFIPTGRGLCNREQLMLGCGEMLSLFERVAAKRRRQLGVDGGERPTAMTSVRAVCGIADVLTVQADGSILPCPNLNQPEHRLGNCLRLGDAELEETFRSPEKAVYLDRNVDRVPGCATCECRYFCGGGCMANAFMCSGDLYGKDPYCGFYRAVWRRHGPLRGKPSPGEVVGGRVE